MTWLAWRQFRANAALAAGIASRDPRSGAKSNG